MAHYVTRQMVWAILMMCLMGTNICYGADQNTRQTDAPPAAKGSVASGEAATPQTTEGQTNSEQSSGMLSGVVDQMHDILREERIKALKEVNKERQETLVEIEAIGNRITEHAINKSKLLIDYFFIRAAEFSAAVFIVAALLGFLFFRKKR